MPRSRFASACRAAYAPLVAGFFAALFLGPRCASAAPPSIGLRPIHSVRLGGDYAVQIPLEELFYWYDDFGASIASIGDVDGDGVGDVAVGAPSRDVAASPGNVIVLQLESDGAVKAAQALGGFYSNAVPGGRQGGDAFGAAVASLGDLDGNGVGDVVVGAPGDDTAEAEAGAIYVLFLGAASTVLSEVKITSGLAGFDFELATLDEFGSALAVVPGPAIGSASVVVGAPGRLDSVGRIFTLDLDETGHVVAATETRGDDDAIAQTAAIGVRFGAAVAVPGDIDGNGIQDFVVGSPSFDTPGDSREWDEQGSVWTLLRNGAGGVQSSVRIGTFSGGFPAELPLGAKFGAAAGAIGDTDDNAVPDVLVGAPGERAAWVLLLSADGAVAEARRFDRESFFEPVPVALGTAVASIGDLDGNGVPDFAIGGDDEFESFPETTTTTLVCTTFVSTTTSITSTTLPLETLLETRGVCGERAHRTSRSVRRDGTPARCLREAGTDVCGRPKYRRCGNEHVRLVFLDENADIADCGDGVRDAGEACDDGNTSDGDCCTADCLTAPDGNECGFDGNPCDEHRCNGEGACVRSPVDLGQECVDHFGCVDAGSCSFDGFCVEQGGPPKLCRSDDQVCHACGQPVTLPGESPVASDALWILEAGIGTRECLACICDADGNGVVAATDALMTLQRAVGLLNFAGSCPHR